MPEGYDQCGLVDVGSDDMALLREVAGLTNNVVAAVVYGCNEGSVNCGGDIYDIPYGNRVGAAYSLESEIAFDLTIEKLAVIRPDCVVL